MRAINPLEINKQLDHLPDEIFGYVYGWQISNLVAKDGLNLQSLKIPKSILSDMEKRLFFQIRKYSERDIRLVGYLSDEANLSINRNKGFSEEYVIVFPHLFNEFRNETEIKLDNSIIVEERDVEYPNHGTITILEIKKRLIEKIEIATQSVKDTDKNTAESNITKETSHSQNNYYNSQVHFGNGDVIGKDKKIEYPPNLSTQTFLEKLTNNQTLAIPLGGLIFILILFLIYHLFGIDFSQFR